MVESAVEIHEIGEHPSQLAALCVVVLPSWLGLHGCRRCRNGNRSAVEIGGGAQHFQPMPERNTKIFEVLIGQVGENGHINVVLGEPLRELGHAARFEPTRNLLHCGDRGSIRT